MLNTRQIHINNSDTKQHTNSKKLQPEEVGYVGIYVRLVGHRREIYPHRVVQGAPRAGW